MYKPLSVSVRYIGADDLTVPRFENQFPIPQGMSYNSYLIEDEKVAVLDTTDIHCAEAWKTNLQEALNGRQPDYLLIQHMEPDHSALALDLLKAYPAMQVVGTARALTLLEQFFPEASVAGRTLTVKDGDTLCLGMHVLRFLTAPMVHWPEVMVTYDETEHILFTADAFGKFGALSVCGFTGEEDKAWADEARRYYVNICGKYGAPVQALLQKVSALDVRMLCPLHGPVLSDNLTEYVHLYDTWSRYDAEDNGVLIAYASIYGGTEAVARRLADMLSEAGKKACLMDVCATEVSYALAEVFRYRTVVLAASSYDAGLFPPMYDLLHHMQIKACQNKRIALIENGSWAPTAGRVMRDMLAEMKNMEMLEPVVTIRSRMKQTDICQLQTLVQRLVAE